RGGTGVINVRVMERNGPVVGIKSVGEEDQLLVITRMGMMIRFPAAEVRETGRDAQGVKVIDLDDGDAVVAVAKLASLGEREEPADEPEDPDAPSAPAPAGDEPESE
ncbi:MAG: DNA gyrase subunit A, partial [Thermoanaerobaculia bacterium]|nr:DNA gyrase subunit A [Thermoanaerobaculia bacterium]